MVLQTPDSIAEISWTRSSLMIMVYLYMLDHNSLTPNFRNRIVSKVGGNFFSHINLATKKFLVRQEEMEVSVS
jgi:hypothetical protein